MTLADPLAVSGGGKVSLVVAERGHNFLIAEVGKQASSAMANQSGKNSVMMMLKSYAVKTSRIMIH